MARYMVVFITVDSKKAADRITNVLIEKKLAACVSSVPRVVSVYRWKGRVERAKEILLVAKTRTSLVGKLISEVKNNHPYEVPEIISIPIGRSNPDYLNWIEKETAK